MEFSHDLANALVQSAEQFPIDFDDAWQWIGYYKKQDAKLKLESNFVEGMDFLRIGVKSTKGRPSEHIKLTVDCFKSFCMMAGTERGKEVRRYFIECEYRLKQTQNKPLAIPPHYTRLDELELEICKGLEQMEAYNARSYLSAVHSRLGELFNQGRA